jgi:proteasome lid subunit RPN8/RPN11
MPIFRPRRDQPTTARLGSTPTAITRRCLDSALACAGSAFPNEFGGILRADVPGVITDLLLLPGTTAGRRHANFQLHMMPVDLGVAGTVHSHPSGALHPSQADVTLFRHWGKAHLILGYPFSGGSWRSYDGNGRERPIKVVDRPGGTEEGSPIGTYRPRAVHRGPRNPKPDEDDDFPEDEE